MKKLTKKQFEDASVLNLGNHENKVIQAILKLKVNEGLEVLREDWKPMTSLGVMWGTYKKRYGIEVKIRRKSNRDGWVVLRVK